MCEKIKIKIYGFNQKHIVDYLIEKGVLVLDLKTKTKYIVFFIYLKDKVVLDKYCKIYNKKYEIVKVFSFKEKLKNVKFNLGMLFAFFLALCYVFSFNFIIFDVTVYNNTNINYDLNKINDVLKKHGIESGVLRKKINSSDIEFIVLNELNDIVGCGVEFIGGKININIVPEIIKKQTFQKQLISKYDAVITDIEVVSGKSDFKIGDIVKVGDLIVNSENIAEAKIKGNVYFSASLLYNRCIQKMKYTGNFFVDKTFYLFNKKLFKKQNYKHFSNYLTKKCDFYIMENYLFPIKCESVYYFECDVINEIVEFETVENDLKQKLYDEVCLKIPKDANILNTYYSIVKEGDFTRLDCFIEVNVGLI